MGQYRNDVYHGQGVETWSNGFYDGEWINGLPSGQGRMKLGDALLEGTWKNGCLFKDGKLDAWYSAAAKKACE